MNLPAETSCVCHKCRNMCKIPCLPLPEEAKKLVDSGMGCRLMLRTIYLESEDLDIDVLCPASKGDEGKRTSHNWTNRCTFQNRYGLCELHGNGKPMEGRLTDHANKNGVGLLIHNFVAMSWNTDDGMEIIREWKSKVKLIDSTGQRRN